MYPASQTPLILGQLQWTVCENLRPNALTPFHSQHHLNIFLLSAQGPFWHSRCSSSPSIGTIQSRSAGELIPWDSPQPMMCENQWMHATASYPQGDKSQRHSAQVSSSLSRIKPLLPMAMPSIFMLAFSPSLLPCLFPEIISQKNYLHSSSYLRLCFHGNPKKRL